MVPPPGGDPEAVAEREIVEDATEVDDAVERRLGEKVGSLESEGFREGVERVDNEEDRELRLV